MWIAYAILCASALLHLALYLTDHRSTALLVLAVVVALFALGGIGASLLVAFRLTPRQLDHLRDRARRWRDLYLGGGLLIGLGFGLGMRPELIYSHSALMLGVGLALGYRLLYADLPLSRRWIVVAALGVIAVTLVRLYGLSVYPKINVIDEPWDLSWALSYVRTGRFFDPIIYYGNGDIQRFMLPVAWWIELVGTGFWQVRLFFFLLIVPLVAITARIGYNLYGRGAGWLVALFMGCSVAVIDAARIRHDIGLALALAASLLLYTEAIKRERSSLHFVAGLLMGWGWFAHYHAIGFGIAMAFSLYLPRYVERIRRGQWLPERALLLYVAGGLLGAASVFVLQILPDWAGFLDRRQLRNPGSLAEYIRVFVAFWGNLVQYSVLEFGLVIAALIAALWRRRPADVLVVTLIITLHLALAVQTNFTWEQTYLLPITPVYAVAVAALFKQVSNRKTGVAWVTAGLVLAPNLGVTLHDPLKHLARGGAVQLPTPAAATWVREHVDPAKLIVGENYYYLFLTDYSFVSPETWKSHPDLFASQDALWDDVAPDVVIADPSFNLGEWRIYAPDYLAARGYEQVAQFPGTNAPILIYEKGGI